MAFNISTGARNKMMGLDLDLITNGVFTSGTTGWSNSNATLTNPGSGQSGNCLSLANSGAAAGYAYQSLTVKPGHLYHFLVYFKAGTAASGTIKVGTSANDATYYSKTGITDVAWTLYDIYVVPTTTTLVLTLLNGDATGGNTTLWDTIQCIWNVGAIKDMFTNSKLQVYTGAQPATADAAPTGTLLVEVTTAGSGNFDLTFAQAASGVTTKTLNATWSGTAVSSGTAGWFRLITNGDSSSLSTTDPRIDGSISTSGAELNMASTSITSGAVQTISTFQLSIPATIT